MEDNMTKAIDVLYIHPTKNLNSTLFSFMPVGAVGLLNKLKDAGFSVYGINYGVERCLDPSYDLLKELSCLSYKALLLDLHWYEHAFGAIEIARLSKKIYPNVPVMIGGLTTTIYAKEILKAFDVIDYALKGDSEQPICDLAKFLTRQEGSPDTIQNIAYRKDEKVIDKPITYCCDDIDAVDNVSDSFLKHNDLYMYANTGGIDLKRKKSVWITVGRGCLYNCSYCDCASRNTSFLWGRDKMFVRSAESVAKDIIRAHEKGADVVRLTHDLEMFGKPYYEKIFNIIKDSGIKIGFNYDAFQLPSTYFVDLLDNTFDMVMIDLTLLSANEKIRKSMGKNFTNDALYALLDHMEGSGIIQRVYYSVNVDGETKEEMRETFNQIKYLLKRYQNPDFFVCYQKVVLEPLAGLRKKERLKIKPTLNTFMDYYKYCTLENVGDIGYTDASSDLYQEKMDAYQKIKEAYKAMGFNNIY